jgi:flagellar hook-associated protein 2
MTTTTSSTATTPSIIATLGAGSGIDMATLTSQLVDAQFSVQTARLDDQDKSLDTQISDASTLKNQITSLASSLGDRVRTGDLTPLPLIANSSVATVARLSSAAPTSGSYTLEVSKVATSQALVSAAFGSAGSAVGSGSLTINFGTVDGTSFTADGSHAPVTIAIPSGTTLQGVADAINSSNSGIKAYVATTTNGTKLMMKGADGAANGFTISASETPGDEGLAALAWTPSNPGSGQLLSTAGDALYKLDGLEMTSATNKITTAIDGLSISLTGTNVGNPTRISFSDPSSNIVSAMTDFVAALNEIQSSLGTMMNAQTGDLRSDPGAQALRRALSQITSKVLMPNAATGDPATLAELGIKTNRDGTYTLDTTMLNAAVAKTPQGVAAMFTPGLYGVFAEVDRISRSAIASADPGSLASSITRYNSLKTKIADQRTAISDESQKLRDRLTQQFSVADSRIASFKSTMSFLTNQIAAWNKSN